MKIIKFLSVNKVPGDNDISVRMIKLCGQSVAKPLSVIFKICINNGIFPDICKKSNIIPVHKKVTSRPLIIIDQFLFYQFVVKYLKNCCSVQCLNFKDSCKYQLLSVVHDIHAAFDCCPSLEVRWIFWTYPEHLIDFGTRA